MITFGTSQGKSGLWYWHAKHRNGRIVADGGQGYTRKHDCKRAVRRFIFGTINSVGGKMSLGWSTRVNRVIVEV